MPAANKNILIEQYAAFELKLVYRDAKRKPINLTGWGARMRIVGADGTVHADLSSDNGKIVLNETAGSIRVLITDEETGAMDFGNEEAAKLVRYDLKLIPPNGMDKRLLQGKASFSKGMTP